LGDHEVGEIAFLGGVSAAREGEGHGWVRHVKGVGHKTFGNVTKKKGVDQTLFGKEDGTACVSPSRAREIVPGEDHIRSGAVTEKDGCGDGRQNQSQGWMKMSGTVSIPFAGIEGDVFGKPAFALLEGFF
jgi:hypothetical protein